MGVEENIATEREPLDANKVGKDKYLAIALIRGSDRGRYSCLVDDLKNQFTMGHNNYPRTVTASYNRLLNYWVTRQPQQAARIINDSESVSFATVERPELATVRCYRCQKKGHYASSCPTRGGDKDIAAPVQADGEAIDALQQLVLADPPEYYGDYEEFSFHQTQRHVNPNWIILDSGSTGDICCSRKLVSNIRLSSRSLKVHCNAGTTVVKHAAALKNYGTVWFNEEGIANILSMALVKKKFPVRYDSTKGDHFVVSKPEKDIIFAASASGFYYHDTTNHAVVMVTTVKSNQEGLTDREFEKAKAAQRSLGLVGYPSPWDFNNMVRSNMIKNSSVTPTDIDNAHKNFGDNIATLRGKILRNTPDAVVADYVEIPKEILDMNKAVTIAADVMFVNGLPFVVTISRKIKFTTTEYVPSRSQQNLVKSLIKIVYLYKTRGFNPDPALMDREFECMRDELLTHGINLNTTAANEHVPDIERQIRVLTERARALRSALPFKLIPGRMIIELLANVVFWINALPPSSGVSKTFSPRTIMTGTAFDFNKYCQIPFGAYAQVHEDNDVTNTMTEGTQPVICLGPTANFQGSYKFLSLKTGKRIARKQFKELPMPYSVIRQVEAMATREKQDKVITFCDRSGDPISDSITALYDIPGTKGADAAAGVYSNENENETDEHDENESETRYTTDEGRDGGDNEVPGIALENEEPNYGETPGVMPTEIPGVPINTIEPTTKPTVPTEST
jgi:hypothetical protein